MVPQIISLVLRHFPCLPEDHFPRLPKDHGNDELLIVNEAMMIGCRVAKEGHGYRLCLIDQLTGNILRYFNDTILDRDEAVRAAQTACGLVVGRAFRTCSD